MPLSPAAFRREDNAQRCTSTAPHQKYRGNQTVAENQLFSPRSLARALCSLMAFISDELSPTLIKLWEYLNFPIEICQDVKTSFPLPLHHHFKNDFISGEDEFKAQIVLRWRVSWLADCAFDTTR